MPVIEPDPPAGVEPVAWLLLTTLPVTTCAEAIVVLDFEGLRWRLEEGHLWSKSGCEGEKSAHNTAERIKRAVMAWHLLVLTWLGRATPEVKT